MGHLQIDSLRTEICHELDHATLGRILELVDESTRADGHRPIGEHKYAHLRVGADGWTGVLAWQGGDLVGYAHTMWGDRPRLRVEVVVRPDLREDGTVARLLLSEVRDVLAGQGGGVLWLWVHFVDHPRSTLAYRLGFGIQRELAFMKRPLVTAPDVPPAPPGVEVRPYRPDVDDDAWLEVNNAAFPDHPENGGWDRSDLRARRTLPWFDPDGLLMAWRADEPVGFHWTKWHGHDSEEVPAHEPVGEVYVLAVHPRAQGTGLGRHLLAVGLQHLHAQGCRQAILYVDRSSQGAVALYESAGFTVQHSEVCYQAEIPAHGDRSRSVNRQSGVSDWPSA